MQHYHYFCIPNQGGLCIFIWEIRIDKAIRLAMANIPKYQKLNCIAKPDQSAVEAISELLNSLGLGNCSHWPLILDPGEYYPRMARPLGQHFDQFPGNSPSAKEDTHPIAMALGQLNVLTRQLAEICQTVHPTHNTLDTYGHAIRNLLILACTEVESHWRGILVANAIKKDRYTTGDYVQILAAMRLDKYSLNFPYYPWLGNRRPFQGWNLNAPTRSLAWYDAYNSVKHDREKSFDRATLGHAFDAVSACAIMMLAQYGYCIPNWKESDSNRFFSIVDRPAWSPSDVYTIDPLNHNTENENWRPVPYKFHQ